MTRRSSQRALAREIYRQMVQARAAAETPNADPPSPGGFGGQGLTARVRALYEHSAVPVAEIARLAGVTERTIYKYARKQRWKKRYRRTPDFAPDLASVRGAGGRFIRRADKGKAFAVGLKATDLRAAAQAGAACARAAALARAAKAEAKLDALHNHLDRAMKATNCVLDQKMAYQDEYKKEHAKPPPADDVVIQAYDATIHGHVDWWQSVSAEIARVRAKADRGLRVGRDNR